MKNRQIKLLRSLIALFSLLVSLPLVADIPVKIDRIEPPSWWIGMADQTLQIMLHGKDIARLKVATSSQGWKITGTQLTDNPNYLFVDLHIEPDAKPGVYQLQISDGNHLLESIDYPLQARNAGSANRKGFSGADVVYLITPDRFVNGDLSNQEIAGFTDSVDRKREGGRHGGDLQGVINSLDYLQNMGFTQLWLNPVLENKQDSYSYHGYSTTDYYRIDPRLGSNDLYRELSAKAKAKGIGLIKDIILNHIGSEHWWLNDMPASDWINHGKKFVATSHRRESLHDPHGTLEDRQAFTDGWFVPSMPDLNQTNPLLANYLIQNSIWWIEFADLSGIRLDTYAYSDKNFLTAYSQRIMAEYPYFNLVGEEWTLNPSIIAYWQRGKQRHDNYQSDMPSMMDFPLQNALVSGLIEKETWSDGLGKIYATLAGDFVYAHPEDLMIFADNHDMSRIYTQLEHNVALTKMALGLIMTTRGIPQLFYGTEILMSNPGTDSHDVIRSEFPGGWSDHDKNAFTGEGLSADEKSFQTYLRKLLNWRKNTPVIHTGHLTHYAPFDGVYVYFRHNENDKVMVVMNKNETKVQIRPLDFPSMTAKNDMVFDIIDGAQYLASQAISISPMSVMILEFK